ncbi:MAG: sulfatase-like hydrolase/transferase [Planctomycetes bacterium]|nr:sulfatase-like hydrolase/transferase [Planctomycetota bacterium]
MAVIVGLNLGLKPPQTTNILIITLDTTRADRLGCYGYRGADTPTLDQIAANGVRFASATSPAPLTLPVHASLFTGLYPPEHGLRTNGRGRLPETLPTLPERLVAVGYDTAAFVSSFVLDSRFGVNRGWKTYNDAMALNPDAPEALQRQRGGAAVVDAALEWLKTPKSAPICLWVHFYDPHFPYDDHADEFGEQFHGHPYDAEIASVDRQIARLLAGLKAAGRAEDLLIIVAGDHGEGLGEHVERTHGYTLYESTQHVPLLFSCPQKIQSGHAVEATVSLVDVFPTVLAFLKLPLPPKLSGRSLLPALHGETIADSVSYAMTDDPFLQNGWSPLRSIIIDRWKYIRTRQPELYDLKSDPGETRNRFATDRERAGDLMRQLAELEQRMTVRTAPAVQLSARERTALQSLGYLGGLTTEPEASEAGSAPDVKEMLRFDVAAQEGLDRLRAGDIEGAVDRLRSIVAESPTHSASRLFLGEALELQGHVDQALGFYADVLKFKPDHLDAHVHMGSALAQQHQFDQALFHLDEALRISPDSASARYNLALTLGRMGRDFEARQQLEEVLKQDDAFPNARTALAGILLQQGHREDALRQYELEMAQNPRGWEARLNLATLIAESDPVRAEKLLVEADSASPNNPSILYNRGAFLLLDHRPQEAVLFLERAVKRFQPPNPRAEQELARARRLAAESPPPK